MWTHPGLDYWTLNKKGQTQKREEAAIVFMLLKSFMLYFLIYFKIITAVDYFILIFLMSLFSICLHLFLYLEQKLLFMFHQVVFLVSNCSSCFSCFTHSTVHNASTSLSEKRPLSLSLSWVPYHFYQCMFTAGNLDKAYL